jgi:hypothetical protein
MRSSPIWKSAGKLPVSSAIKTSGCSEGSDLLKTVCEIARFRKLPTGTIANLGLASVTNLRPQSFRLNRAKSLLLKLVIGRIAPAKPDQVNPTVRNRVLSKSSRDFQTSRNTHANTSSRDTRVSRISRDRPGAHDHNCGRRPSSGHVKNVDN